MPVHTILSFFSPLFTEIFPLGLETFSQLVYEDNYGAVSYNENIFDVGLHRIVQANLFFTLEKHQCNINQRLPQISTSRNPP